MAPTVVRDGKFRFFFFSREEERIHIHVAHPDGEAKFWLTPDVTLAMSVGLSAQQLRAISSRVTLDFTRFRRHISTSSSKLLECQRAQLV